MQSLSMVVQYVLWFLLVVALVWLMRRGNIKVSKGCCPPEASSDAASTSRPRTDESAP